MGAAPDMHELLNAAWAKADRAAALYLHSASKLEPFDATRSWTADELEPYDALVTRFERLIEVLLKFFRVVEAFETAGTGSTVRDCLALMTKLGLIEEVDAWMEMREVRNRIAHDYLPDNVGVIYSLLLNTYRPIVANAVAEAREYVRLSRER